jgi:hypothetical protein
MEVKINIEANQIGDTVIDLFTNLSDEKKEELASQVVKQYLDDKAREQVRWNDSLLQNVQKKINDYLVEDLKKNETFIESRDKCIDLLLEKLPEIITQAMTIVVASQLSFMGGQLTETVMKNMGIEARLNEVRQRMNMY